MDESTSALDEASQESLRRLFKKDLADVTVITVGHRPSLAENHQGRLILIKQKQKEARPHHAEAVAPQPTCPSAALWRNAQPALREGLAMWADAVKR